MNPSPTAAPASPQSSRDAAFEFVRQLAVELSGTTLELPGYPDVALKVQRLLADDSVTTDRLVRLLGAEPTLSARILTLANSALYNVSGETVADLRKAITRLGFNSLRAAAISIAMAQQRKAEAFKSILQPMQALWDHSVEVSALCLVLARVNGRFNPDTALLAGIVSGVGELYILTRASAHPVLFADTEAYGDIVRNWQGGIAQALLENWQMAEEIVFAVRDYATVEDEDRDVANLADVLAAAQLLVAVKDAPDGLEGNVSGSRALARLGLDAAACTRLLTESADEVAAVRATLRD